MATEMAGRPTSEPAHLSIQRNFGVSGSELALDVERRTALADQLAMQRADVGALAVVLLEGSEPIVRAAEPAAKGLHCGWRCRLPLGLGLGGQRLEHLKPPPDAVGQAVAVHRLLAAFQIVGAVLL